MSQQVSNAVAPPSSIVHSRLLSNNEVPDPLEAASVYQGINDLKGEISRLQSQLEDLERQLQNHRGVLSAVRRIPTEIWGKIFAFVLPFRLTVYERTELLRLALVCRTWCQAARLTHQLWNAYSLDTHPPSYEAAKSWLSRSGTLPKSLQVDGLGCSHHREFRRGDGGEFWCPIVHPEFVKLLSEGPVLHHLSLRCQVPLCFKKLCERLHPSLWSPIKSLSILIQDGWDEVVEGEEPSDFFDIPASVTSLEICPSPAWVFGRPLCISPTIYAQLTSLSVSGTVYSNVTQLLQALQHSTSLESLTIDFRCDGWRYDDEPYQVVGGSVSLPCLRTLHLQRACKTDVLKYLMMPALTELVVRGERSGEPRGFWWTFPDPEVRSPNLRILRLYAPLTVHPSELAATLRCLPHLTELTLSRAVSDSHTEEFDPYEMYERHDDFIFGNEPNEEELEGNNMETPMCDVFQILRSWDEEGGAIRNLPFLQHLEVLDLPGDYNFSYLSDYIQARFWRLPDRPLKTLTVTFLPTHIPNNCSFGDFKNVHEELERAGVSASITPSVLEPRERESYLPLYRLSIGEPSEDECPWGEWC